MLRPADTTPRDMLILEDGVVGVDLYGAREYLKEPALLWSTDCPDPVPVLKCVGTLSEGPYVIGLNIIVADGDVQMYLVHCPRDIFGKMNARALRGCLRLMGDPEVALCLALAEGGVECVKWENNTLHRGHKTGAWLPMVSVPQRKPVNTGHAVEVECGHNHDVFYIQNPEMLHCKEVQLAYVGLYLYKWSIIVLPELFIFSCGDMRIRLKVSNDGTPGKPGLAYKVKEL